MPSKFIVFWLNNLVNELHFLANKSYTKKKYGRTTYTCSPLPPRLHTTPKKRADRLVSSRKEKNARVKCMKTLR